MALRTLTMVVASTMRTCQYEGDTMIEMRWYGWTGWIFVHGNGELLSEPDEELCSVWRGYPTTVKGSRASATWLRIKVLTSTTTN